MAEDIQFSKQVEMWQRAKRVYAIIIYCLGLHNCTIE